MSSVLCNDCACKNCGVRLVYLFAKVVILEFLRKREREPKKIYKLQGNRLDVSGVGVVCDLFRLEREKESEEWKHLHVGSIDGISCQHLQVMVTQLLQKHWEWQEDTRIHCCHGTESKPTSPAWTPNSVRCGEAQAYCENYGCSWMDPCWPK